MCWLLRSLLSTYMKLRTKNLRTDRFWTVSIQGKLQRSIKCFYTQRSPLPGMVSSRSDKFRWLHWISSHAFNFTPFSKPSGKDHTVTFFVAFLDDIFSNLDVDFVPLLPQATSMALSGDIRMLTVKAASSHFRQTACVSFTVSCSGLLKTPFFPLLDVEVYTGVFTGRVCYDLLKVILLANEDCNLNSKPCLSVTFILLCLLKYFNIKSYIQKEQGEN